MTESNKDANGAAATTDCTTTPTIHLVLQGKGGVGKTVIAGWLAEFLISRGQPVHCIDGDPVNRSLAQYKALPVEKLDLVSQEGIVKRSRYDGLVNRFLNEQAVFVVDSGATAFLPLWSYIVESDIAAVLRERGRRVYVHIPISGGEMLNDTLLGFETLAATAAEKSLIVWLNEYFGPILSDGKTFDRMQVYLHNRDKVLTSIGIPQRPLDTFGENIQRMREGKLTFEEAIRTAPGFYVVEKSRLYRVRRDLFEQLEQTPFA